MYFLCIVIDLMPLSEYYANRRPVPQARLTAFLNMQSGVEFVLFLRRIALTSLFICFRRPMAIRKSYKSWVGDHGSSIVVASNTRRRRIIIHTDRTSVAPSECSAALAPCRLRCSPTSQQAPDLGPSTSRTVHCHREKPRPPVSQPCRL